MSCPTRVKLIVSKSVLGTAEGWSACIQVNITGKLVPFFTGQEAVFVDNYELRPVSLPFPLALYHFLSSCRCALSSLHYS